MAYLIDLQEKALNCYKQYSNASKAAKTYGISRNTLYLWIRLEEQTGSLKHQVSKGKMPLNWIRKHSNNILNKILMLISMKWLRCLVAPACTLFA